ncbi:MAG TPA: TetR/AcrR family transcriptional regulator [Lunatimonas sp.]|nr:TetR/AcrR family transcriptional regulator [Lunatimonas sp.]
MNKAEMISIATSSFNEHGFRLTEGEKLIQQSGIPLPSYREEFGSVQALVFEIFAQLCEESDCISQGLDAKGTTLKNLLNTTIESYRVQTKFRFIFLNLHEIIEQIEPIKDRYYELISLRKSQLIHLFQLLENDQLMRGEVVSGQYDNLANQMIILSDFWLTHNNMVFGQDNFKPEYYSKLVLSILVPYLTESGLEDYRTIDA